MPSASIIPGANASHETLQVAREQLRSRHREFISQGLNLDLTRGKPSTRQLDLSNAMLGHTEGDFTSAGVDLRNYGVIDGLPQAKHLFGVSLERPLVDLAIREGMT